MRSIPPCPPHVAVQPPWRAHPARPSPAFRDHNTDSPGSLLTADLKEKCACDDFWTHLLYKPTGTSIWVPLRKVNWTWSGNAVRDNPQWDQNDLVFGSNSTNPASVNSITHPTWSANVTSLTWQPE